MNSNFYHFTTFGNEPKVTKKRPEELIDKIEDQINKMIESGERTGEIILDIPEDFSEEETKQLIDEVLKRFGNE